MSLCDFEKALGAALTSGNLAYKISGTAKIFTMGGGVVYSGSLVPHLNEKMPSDPSSHLPMFQKLKCDGYSFKTLEILTFNSSNPTNKPYWRYQVKYTHK